MTAFKSTPHRHGHGLVTGRSFRLHASSGSKNRTGQLVVQGAAVAPGYSHGRCPNGRLTAKSSPAPRAVNIARPALFPASRIIVSARPPQTGRPQGKGGSCRKPDSFSVRTTMTRSHGTSDGSAGPRVAADASTVALVWEQRRCDPVSDSRRSGSLQIRGSVKTRMRVPFSALYERHPGSSKSTNTKFNLCPRKVIFPT